MTRVNIILYIYSNITELSIYILQHQNILFCSTKVWPLYLIRTFVINFDEFNFYDLRQNTTFSDECYINTFSRRIKMFYIQQYQWKSRTSILLEKNEIIYCKFILENVTAGNEYWINYYNIDPFDNTGSFYTPWL